MLSSNEPGRRVHAEPVQERSAPANVVFFRQMDLVWNNLQVVVMRHLRTWANLQGQLSEYEKDAKCRVLQNGVRHPQLLLGKKKKTSRAFGCFWTQRSKFLGDDSGDGQIMTNLTIMDWRVVITILSISKYAPYSPTLEIRIL